MEENQSEINKKESPPYIGFSTFLSFFKGLKETGAPGRVDKSLLRNMSGSNQSAMISALRWFKLIDKDNNPSADFEALALAGDESAPILKRLIHAAYPFVGDGSLNIEKATGAQIEEKFRSYGLNGATVAKGMAFFISACKHAALPISPHIKPPKVAKTTLMKTRKRTDRQANTEDGEQSQPPPPAHPPPKTSSQALMEKFPAFDPGWTPEIQTKWFDAFSKMQSLLDK